MAHLALVTGGSRGIGAAIAKALRTQGFEVLTPSRADLDLSSSESVARFVQAHKDRGIDTLVNNAGINVINEIEATKPEDWAAMMQVNLTSPFLLAQGLVPGMKKKRWGRIVNISSVFGVVTKEKRTPYSVTKSGINGMTRTLAVELASHGILVNSVGPGYVNTELTYQNNTPDALAEICRTIPAGRLAEPAEIAELVSYLCSEKNTYLTGQTIVADGGFSCK